MLRILHTLTQACQRGCVTNFQAWSVMTDVDTCQQMLTQQVVMNALVCALEIGLKLALLDRTRWMCRDVGNFQQRGSYTWMQRKGLIKVHWRKQWVLSKCVKLLKLSCWPVKETRPSWGTFMLRLVCLHLFASLLPWKSPSSYEVLTRTEQSGLVFESYEPPGEGHFAALEVFRHSFPSTFLQLFLDK